LPEWLAPWLTPGSLAAFAYFIWRLERRVFRIELLLKLTNGKATP